MKSREQMINEVLASHAQWLRKKSHDPKGTLLLGDLVVADRTGSTNTFSMEIFVPKDFPSPGLHPRARILRDDLGKKLTADAHVEPDGGLCIQLPQRNQLDYVKIGLSGFMEHVVVHLHRARIWALDGPPFPGPEYGHGALGRREFASELPQLLAPYEALGDGLSPSLARLLDPSASLPTERARCPCGSGTQFYNCHGALILARRAKWMKLGPRPRALD